MNTNEVKSFLSAASTLSHKDLLIRYMDICDDLLFEEESLVRDVIDVLITNIRVFARRRSNVYGSMEKMGVIGKAQLLDQSRWFVPEIPHRFTSTSGTSSGGTFQYIYWQLAYQRIERDFHYHSILKEFGVDNCPKILCILSQYSHPVSEDNVIIRLPYTTSYIHTHGSSNAIVYSVNLTHLYQQNSIDKIKKIIDFMVSEKLDVLLASGPTIQTLRHYCDKFSVSDKVCRLLSNTCEPLPHEDVAHLKVKGLIDHCCDHMRCWDGGASFFTCKEGTYHLMDNLAYSYTHEDKLVSTDYFSLAAPFVNYWNGDYAQISNDYLRCKCGRLYRPFQFLQAREFSYAGITSSDIKKRLKRLGIQKIKQVKCYQNAIEIVLRKPLLQDEEQAIRDSLPNMGIVRFTLESS